MVYLWRPCRIKLKIAPEGLAFSVFLWAHFFWNLPYCHSCPLPVRITSPGTRSSSRAHSSPRPTPFPPRSLQCFCIDYLGDCGCVFCPSFPSNPTPPSCLCGLCSPPIFHRTERTLLPSVGCIYRSRTCWPRVCTPSPTPHPRKADAGDTVTL